MLHSFNTASVQPMTSGFSVKDSHTRPEGAELSAGQAAPAIKPLRHLAADTVSRMLYLDTAAGSGARVVGSPSLGLAVCVPGSVPAFATNAFLGFAA
ncbi:MAG: hypothetical protein WDW38_003883 [Sanguina aurantia]